MFDLNLFQKELSTSWLGRELFFFDELESTNTFAKNLERKTSKHGAIVVANYQSKGRGQYDREWQSEPGLNLTFSIVFEPSKADRLTVLTLTSALAIAEIIEELTNDSISIKWPNDVLVNEKKIAGLLTETLFNGDKLERVIVGIGLNVNQENFEKSLNDNATSLRSITSKDTSREILLARLLSRIEFYYRFWDSKDIELIKKINKKFIGYGKWTNLVINDKPLEQKFKFLGINESGHMVVLNKDLEVNTFSYEQVRVHFDSKKG